MKINLKAENSDKNKRFDIFLLQNFTDFSRSYLKQLIDNGSVLLNGKKVKSGEKIKTGDVINGEIQPPLQIDLKPENIDFETIYEDEDLLVINKPQGLVVHPGGGSKSGTLVNALLAKITNLSGINGKIRPGIVHRLDKNTSGLMLVAKNDKAHISLSSQISNKTCRRAYIALVEGNVKTDEGKIETRIIRSKTDRKKMIITHKNEGKIAISDYKVVKRYNTYTLLRFELLTGRTHQIRVHSRHIGHPIVGDEVYGNKINKFKLKGQLLHSFFIEFTHPTTNKTLNFEIPIPYYFQAVLDKLK